MINKNIGIIGCGNMGEALLGRLSNVIRDKAMLLVSEKEDARRQAIQKKYKIAAGSNNAELAKKSDVIIFAIKPKDFENVLSEIRSSVSKSKLLISIAAGITTGYIEKVVGKDIPVVRVMPNMPAMIGEAISSISAGSSAAAGHVKLARDIFSTIGDVVEVNEDLADSVTAISGSGPAYFFYLVESLIEAAKELGLDEKTARTLVHKTAIGSLKLLDWSKEEAAVLRSRVTSKGGTTEAAMKIFDDKTVKEIVKDAARHAHKRSRELSQG